MSDWFTTLKPNPNARLRLICLPYAGGSAGVFSSLADGLTEDIELVALQLPGRGVRLMETPYDSLPDLVQDLMSPMSTLTTKPYVLFGHSFGSRLGFEVMRKMGELNIDRPVHFIASGCKAAHIRSTDNPIHMLPETQFLAKLSDYGGTHKEIMANAELLSMLLPMLRADFKMAETHKAEIQTPFSCSVSVFGGINDAGVSEATLLEWQVHFIKQIELTLFNGGHFFLEKQRQEFGEKINFILEELLLSIPSYELNSCS